MLYQPSYPQPYLSDVDATLANTFSCYINAEGGTQIIAYKLSINDMSGASIYTTGQTTLATPLYNQNTLSISVPTTSGMVNGINYVWNVTLYENHPAIWVTSGVVQSTGTSTTTAVYISPSVLISVGQYLQIGTEQRQITAYDTSTGVATVATAFSTAPTSGTSYTVYTDNVTSNDYYFQARTTPTLVVNNLPYTSATQSGDIMSVSDSAGQNLQSLVVNGVTSNPGTQTPSAPITLDKVGSAENVLVTGKNLISRAAFEAWCKSYDTAATVETVDGHECINVSSGSINGKSFYLPFVSNKQLTIKLSARLVTALASDLYIYLMYSDGSHSSMTFVGSTIGTTLTTKVLTTNSGKVPTSFVFYYANSARWYISLDDLQIELGTTATAYEPYIGNSFPIGRDLYAYDTKDLVSGAVSVGHGIVDLGTLDWSSGTYNGHTVFLATPSGRTSTAFDIICSSYPTNSVSGYGNLSDKQIIGSTASNIIAIRDDTYTDATAFKTAMSGVLLLYELATPTTATDTAQILATPVGNMVISSDSAVLPTLDATYYTSTLVVTTKSYTFNATYTQAENVGWKYYQWTLYNSSGTIINQSDQITTGAITYTFDGLIDDTTYGVGLTLENQDGIVLEIPTTYFTVNYSDATPTFTNTITPTVICNSDAIELSWNKVLTNAGTAEGTGSTPYYTLVANTPYTGGSSVQLNSGADIYWYTGSSSDMINIPFNSTTYFYWKPSSSTFTGTIYKQEGVVINLLTVSLGAPTTCATGDKYYNLTTDLIYMAIATDTWGQTGTTPASDTLYLDLTNSQKYVYNGTTLIPTSQSAPYYIVSLTNGAAPYFTYTIFDGTTTSTGTIALNTTTAGILQSTATALANTSYVWSDSQAWNDSYYWVDSLGVTAYWYKMTLLPTGLRITKLTP